MRKILFLALFLSIILGARDNPFFPTEGEVDIPNTSNAKVSLAPLKRAAIAIPSQARAIKKVTVEFVNLDGSTQKKSIELNNAVDWYLPIFISQSMGQLNTKKYSKENKSVQSSEKTKYTQFYSLGFITFYKKNKEIKVATSDKLLRDFLLTSPHRIVMDFQRDLNMKTRVKVFEKQRYYKKISFGVHDHYYRIVLELDGYYRYKKEVHKQGYSFFLK